MFGCACDLVALALMASNWQDEPLPASAAAAGPIVDVCVTYSQTAVVLTKSGNVFAWYSKLMAKAPAAATVPATLQGRVAAISCGLDHVVVQLQDGSAAAFGDKISVPASAEASSSVKGVAAGHSHSVFLLTASGGKVVQDGTFV
jgi:alpha-tubulin suppressor-like RCC1 family protein